MGPAFNSWAFFITLRIRKGCRFGCQVATCFEALFGVSLGESGVSIVGVKIVRV